MTPDWHVKLSADLKNKLEQRIKMHSTEVIILNHYFNYLPLKLQLDLKSEVVYISIVNPKTTIVFVRRLYGMFCF